MDGRALALDLGEVIDIKFGCLKAQGTIINLRKQFDSDFILITLSLFLGSYNYVLQKNPTGHFSVLLRVLAYQSWWEILVEMGRQRSCI